MLNSSHGGEFVYIKVSLSIPEQLSKYTKPEEAPKFKALLGSFAHRFHHLSSRS